MNARSQSVQAKINYAGPWITEKEVEYVVDAVRNGFYHNYKVHATRLEESICRLTGAKHAIATNSCTAALHLAFAALGTGPGDEVITTDSTCVATGLGPHYTGATCVFVDVDPDTWCLSSAAVRRAVTAKTRAILACHWNGHPAEMDEILAIARQGGIPVVEDAAQALGADYKGRKVGTLGEIGCFSFQGAKVAIAGLGGAVVTDRDDLAEKMRILANFGRTDSVMQYWSDYVGFNYSMPNLPAALALAQVERLDELIDKKRSIFQCYEQGLADCDRVKLIYEAPGTKSTYCYPCCLLTDRSRLSRNDLLAGLRKDNIDCRPAQPRLSGFPFFSRRFENPNSERVESHGVILASAFNLEEDDIRFVCKRIRELL
jgi:perosamine synthetase